MNLLILLVFYELSTILCSKSHTEELSFMSESISNAMNDEESTNACQIIFYLKKKRGKTGEKGKRKTFPEA